MINNQAVLFHQSIPSQNAVSMNYCNSPVSYFLPYNSSSASFIQYQQSQQQMLLQSMQNSSASQSQINHISQNHLISSNMVPTQTISQQIPKTFQGIQYTQQNIPCFQVLSPRLMTFDQNNQQKSASAWNQPIVQQPILQNQCELQYQFQSQLVEMQQFQQFQQQQQQLQQSLQYQNQLQQQQLLAYQQQKQYDCQRLQQNSQFQGQLTHPSQQELQECQSSQPQESHHLHTKQSLTQIEMIPNIQQKSSQDTNEEIIFSKNKTQQSHSTLPPQQSCSFSGGKCPKITKIIQKLKPKQLKAEVTSRDKKQTESLRTSNYENTDSSNKNSDNLNQNFNNNTGDNTKRQRISGQQQLTQQSSLVSPKKQKNVRIKKQHSNEDAAKQSEEQFKLSLIEQLQPSMKEIVNLSIQMNRQNINRNLIKAFKKYVHEQVKYTLNYEKLSAQQYHFKSCQNLPVIINRDPNDKEREMFRKKFNKFIGSKQHSNNDLKQIIENRLYSLLFKEFLKVEIGELVCLNGGDKQTDYNVVIQFYLLCIQETQYIVFLNDSLALNKKNALCFSGVSNGVVSVESLQSSEPGSRSQTIIHPSDQQEPQKISELPQLLPTDGGFDKQNTGSNESSQMVGSEQLDSPEKSQNQNKEMDGQMMVSKTQFLEETNKTESLLNQPMSYESIEKEQANYQNEVNNQFQNDQSLQKMKINTLAQELFEFQEELKNVSI